MEQYLDKFLFHLKEKGVSPHTIKSYKYSILKFFKVSEVSNPSQITHDKVVQFRKSLKMYKKNTRNLFLVSLRQFLDFLNQEKVVSLSSDDILLITPERSRPAVITSEIVSKLLSLPDRERLDGLRDLAILSLIFSTGLKVSEVSSLNRDSLDLPGCRLKVRDLLLGDVTRSALERYLSGRGDQNKALFIRLKGQGDDLRLSVRSIERMISKYAFKLGLRGKITPQILRHSFALNQIDQGQSRKSLQKILGYSYLSSTQVYTKNL